MKLLYIMMLVAAAVLFSSISYGDEPKKNLSPELSGMTYFFEPLSGLHTNLHELSALLKPRRTSSDTNAYHRHWPDCDFRVPSNSETGAVAICFEETGLIGIFATYSEQELSREFVKTRRGEYRRNARAYVKGSRIIDQLQIVEEVGRFLRSRGIKYKEFGPSYTKFK